jgi:exonuclease 3'-5' domain-containing protein 1
MDETRPYSLLDTCEAVSGLVDALSGLPNSPPSIYVDLEGVKLSRHGSVSIIQFFVLPVNHTYLVDIHILGENAFLTCGANGQTLRDILQSDLIPKAFFDVRNDSDALYSHFRINLAGIEDIQLMELATRTFSKKYVKGLSKCIEMDLTLTWSEMKIWKSIKEKGLNLFEPDRGGSHEVFNIRPLSEDIILYCIQDVKLLPRLWQTYHSKLTQNWAVKVEEATKERVDLSKTESYVPHGKHKALGHWA